MKLYIGAPVGELSTDALKLASTTMLPIRQDARFTQPLPVFEPELSSVEFLETVTAGFIHAVRVVDEFRVLKNSTHMIVRNAGSSRKVNPRLAERHLLMFQNRFTETGVYEFDIVHDQEGIIFGGQINVVNS